MINLYDLEEYLPGHGYSSIYGIGDGTNKDGAIMDHEDFMNCATCLGMVPI